MDIDSVKVEIEASSDKAAAEVKRTTDALKELRKETNQNYKNPLAELADANEVDVLKAKLGLLRGLMEDAIGGGKGDKAIRYRQQILSTEKALRRAEKAAEAARKATEAPASGRLFGIANANEIDALQEKLLSLNEKMNAAINGGDSGKAANYRLQILRTESALRKAEAQALKSASANNAVAKSLEETAAAAQSVTDSLSANDARRYALGDPTHQWAMDMQKLVEFEDKPEDWGIRGLIHILDPHDVEYVASAANQISSAVQSAAEDASEAVSEATSSAVTSITGFAQHAEYAGVAFKRAFIDGVASVARLAADAVKSVGSALLRLPKGAYNGLANAFKRIGDSAKSAIAPVTKLLKAVGRVAFYRIVRSMIKEVTTAFSEGLEYAYKFSAGISGTGHRFADAMDSIKSSSTQMKAQLGSAFISLLAAVRPIIEAIINLVIMAANAISQLIAAFTGTTYLRAGKVADKFADTMKKGAGSAKEWKNQLLGFDEINRLNEPSSGGGGSGFELDTASMFEATEINKKILDFVRDLKSAIRRGDWAGAGKLLGQKIMSLFPSEQKWKEWGDKLGKGLNGAIQTLYHTLSNINFFDLGTRLAEFLNSFLNQEGMFSTLGASWVKKFTNQLDFFIGFLGRLDWGLVGKSVGDFLRGALTEATTWLSGKDWEQIGRDIFTKFNELIKGIDFNSLAKAFFEFLGAAFGAIGLTLAGYFDDSVQKVKDYWNEKLEETGGDTWGAFCAGVKEAWVNITQWCKENIVDPFIKGLRAAFGLGGGESELNKVGIDAVKKLKGGAESEASGLSRWAKVNIADPVVKFLKTPIGSPSIPDEYYSVGENSVKGLKKGAEDEAGGFFQWCKNTLVDPLVSSVKSLLGIHSPSTVFSEIGSNIVSGLREGIGSAWGGLESWFSGLFSSLISWCQSAHVWLQDVLDGISLVRSQSGSMWQSGGGFAGSAGKFASGGHPDTGQLFVAREAGPELVGTMNGQTTVATNADIVAGIRQGVFEAVSAAMNGQGGETVVKVYLDSREIKNGQQRYARAMGV